MVGLLRRNFLWILFVSGIFVITVLNNSEAFSMANSPKNDTLDRMGIRILEKFNKDNNATFIPADLNLERLQKTSSKCSHESTLLCSKSNNQAELVRSSRKGRKVALTSHSGSETSILKNFDQSISTRSNNDYIAAPVYFQPYGHHQMVSEEGRGWITIPLFIFFSIIQFKLVSAIFLAVFGPMILFLLIVQGFLFKATIVLLGLMMT